MRIRICASDALFTDDTRAYAEYRFFTSLARHEARVRALNVAIERDSAANLRFLCTVVLDLGASGHLKTQARAAHPNAAIDRAADRAAWLVRRRVASHFSLKPAGFIS